MKKRRRFCCNELASHLDEGEVAIRYVPKFRQFGLLILDGGDAIQEIHYCPWCGGRFQQPLRKEWFKKIYESGFEPQQAGLPKKFWSDKWWMT